MLNPLEATARIAENYRRYLLTTFRPRDERWRQEFRDRLSADFPLFKGPFLEAAAPFETGSSVAALIVEPVQGEGGFVVPAPEFLPALKEFCERNGILFVADEVQTAFGRTGRWWAAEHSGIVPDLLVTAKSLGGGLPIGSVTGPREVMDAVHVGGLGGTFGGNPIACAAALAVVRQIEEDGLLDRAERVGTTMLETLRGFRDRFPVVGDVRGLGAMVAMELVRDRERRDPAPEAATAVLQACHRDGLIVLKAGTYDNVVRLLPPLTIDEGLLEEGLGILEKALAAAEPAP